MKPEVEDDEAMNRVRRLIGDLLEDDQPPIVISYALAYVSAEFGLRVEEDARRVLSTLLGALARATADAVPSEAESDPIASEARSPDGVTKQ